MDNIRLLSQKGANIIFRTPLIPTVNDSELPLIAAFIKSLNNSHPLELLKYHKIGTGKYEALGMDYRLENIEPKELDEYIEYMKSAGVAIKSE